MTKRDRALATALLVLLLAGLAVVHAYGSLAPM